MKYTVYVLLSCVLFFGQTKYVHSEEKDQIVEISEKEKDHLLDGFGHLSITGFGILGLNFISQAQKMMIIESAKILGEKYFLAILNTPYGKLPLLYKGSSAGPVAVAVLAGINLGVGIVQIEKSFGGGPFKYVGEAIGDFVYDVFNDEEIYGANRDEKLQTATYKRRSRSRGGRSR